MESKILPLSIVGKLVYQCCEPVPEPHAACTGVPRSIRPSKVGVA